MATGLVIREAMSGWISLNKGEKALPFNFRISAFTLDIFKFNVARPFKGEVEIGEGNAALPIEGVLALKPTGPNYSFSLNHPSQGKIHIKGNKTYSLMSLKKSFTTCPLKVYKDDVVIGEAELVYRDPILSFPFSALRLVDEADGYLPFEKTAVMESANP